MVTSLKGGKQRPEVNRTSEMSVLSDSPNLRHCGYLADHLAWSEARAARRRDAVPCR